MIGGLGEAPGAPDSLGLARALGALRAAVVQRGVVVVSVGAVSHFDFHSKYLPIYELERRRSDLSQIYHPAR